MKLDLFPIILQGANLGLDLLIKAGGDKGQENYEKSLDALDLAADIIKIVVPKARDGVLTGDEIDEAVEQLRGKVPDDTLELTMKIVRSALDRIGSKIAGA